MQKQTDILRKERKKLLKQLDKLGNIKKGTVPQTIAIQFIEECAYWYGHPSGGPVHAPNHSRNIKSTDDRNWQIDFGANTFLVGNAISKCQKTIQNLLNNISLQKIKKNTLVELRKELLENIAGSVSNYGRQYRTYPVSKGHMIFGTQSIYTNDFITLLLRIVPVDSFILKYLSEKEIKKNDERVKRLFQKIIDRTRINVLPKDYNYFLNELKQLDPNFNIKATSFKKFGKLIAFFVKNEKLRVEQINRTQQVVFLNKTRRQLSKPGKKAYKNLCQATSLDKQIEYAVSTLVAANSVLMSDYHEQNDAQSCFSALCRAIFFNGYPVNQFQKHLFRIFSLNFQIISGESVNKRDIEDIISTTQNILEMAGILTP
ncbi:hypothetical protein QUF76_03990 [Desulfobacterales bacterium HSG16]|nr:hypothetical protein [Desulfobacterales bacterium HSG16]